MDITQFVEGSIGQWQSPRSSYHLIFGHFAAMRSEIEIIAATPEHPKVIELDRAYEIDPNQTMVPLQISWER